MPRRSTPRPHLSAAFPAAPADDQPQTTRHTPADRPFRADGHAPAAFRRAPLATAHRSRAGTARTALAALLATGMLTTALTGCDAGGAGDPERVDVVAAFYPLQFVAERVGGGAVAVTNLVKPGAEPHDTELSPVQVGQVAEAELVIYLKGFQPAVDDAVKQRSGGRTLDVATVVPLLTAQDAGHQHAGEAEEAKHREESGTRDPHLWLDPTRLAKVGDALAARLADADPDRAAEYRTRAAALRTDLEALDREYATGLKTCQRREVVVSHTAFSYLTKRYGLEQIGLTGLSPEQEPSPQRLAEVTEEAREHKATTIFFETLVSPKVAETIAREVGADTAVLDPLEGLQPGSTGDYFSVMRSNLATLRPALGCS